MPKVLVVADVPWVRNAVHAALPGPEYALIDHEDPATAATTAVDAAVDVVLVDLQVKNMGGMAVARAVRDATAERAAGRIPSVILLDRAADGFLARRAGAEGWIVKPLNGHDLRARIAAALDAVAAGSARE